MFTDKGRNVVKSCFDYYSERNVGHGRIEWRKCWVSTIPEWMKKNYKEWVNLSRICMVESERHIGKKRSIEQRFYISSENLSAKQALRNSREHWSIENQVHHVLDVTFNEDACNVHNAAENMSIVRKIVINLVKKYKTSSKDKSGISVIRKAAAWCDDTSKKILSCLSF